MKNLVYFLILLGLVSCSTVHFNEPQPKNGTRLHDFPVEIQGSWIADSGESMSITESQIITENFEHDSLGNVVDTNFKYQLLSDNLQLYRKGNYFVFNEQYDDGSFRILVGQKEANGDLSFYFCDDPQVYGKMHELKMDSASVYIAEYNSEIDDFIDYDSLIVAPKRKDLRQENIQQVQFVHYSGQLKQRNLKKVCREEYLYCILKSDGTIFVPESDIFSEE